MGFSQNLIIFLGFILGTALGSFTKAIADRAISNRSFWGRSNCEKCKKQLKWLDLIPIVSYVSTGGKCRYCQTRLSVEYLLIEVLMGLLVSLLFFQMVPANVLELPQYKQLEIFLDLLLPLFTICVLVNIFLTDIKTGLIYNRITLPAIVSAFFILLVSTSYKIFLVYWGIASNPLGKYLLPQTDYFQRHALIVAHPLLSGLLAAVLMILFFGSIIFFTKGRGMGGGDLKLSIYLGLAFGFPNTLVLLMLAFLTGSLAGVGLILTSKKKLGQSIPFGPFLSLGAMITLFFGNQIMNWYLNISF